MYDAMYNMYALYTITYNIMRLFPITLTEEKSYSGEKSCLSIFKYFKVLLGIYQCSSASAVLWYLGTS